MPSIKENKKYQKKSESGEASLFFSFLGVLTSKYYTGKIRVREVRCVPPRMMSDVRCHAPENYSEKVFLYEGISIADRKI